MELNALNGLLEGARRQRIACVGDLVVDRFVVGDVSRISPEAPIPVFAQSSHTEMLGAAGNVTRNVAALGASASLVAAVGPDAVGESARALAAATSGVSSLLVTDPDRITSLKTRFLGAGQQLLRVDHETALSISGAVEAELMRAVRYAAGGCGAILLSDYGKGVVTDAVVQAAREAAAAQDIPLIVDSKARSLGRYGPVDLIKPNAAELGAATDLPTSTDVEIETALSRALALWPAKAILVTRAARGMSLAARGAPVRHFPARALEVFDVSGAGDTTLAALGVALAAGAPLEVAVAFAQLAAGVAVAKAGTATVSPQELIEAAMAQRLAPAEAKICTLQRMGEEAARWRERGLKVGFTNGCFDILHKGHIAYLAQARAWCDRLIVGVNSDRSVRALKGEGRPVNDLESRALVLAGLECVDLVAAFDEATPLRLIEAARPDVLIKGADYTEPQVVGADLVRSWGGEVRLAALVDGYSTTGAIARLSAKAAS